MKVLLTGASSFTGYWFAKTLHSKGHEVVAPLRAPKDSYTGFPISISIRLRLVENSNRRADWQAAHPVGKPNLLWESTPVARICWSCFTPAS